MNFYFHFTHFRSSISKIHHGWKIWKYRCKARFGDENMSSWTIIQQVIKYVNLVLNCQFPSLHLSNNWATKCDIIEKLKPMIYSQIIYWHKLEQAWYKLNVDGCSKGNPDVVPVKIIKIYLEEGCVYNTSFHITFCKFEIGFAISTKNLMGKNGFVQILQQPDQKIMFWSESRDSVCAYQGCNVPWTRTYSFF